MEKEGLAGDTVHGTDASIPRVLLNGGSKNVLSLHPNSEREFRATSDSFYLAMQRHSGGAEGNPPVSVIGDSKMREVMRTPEGIPSQVYYFEVNHGSDNGVGPKGDVVTGVEKGKVAGEFIKTSDYLLVDTNSAIKIKEGQGVVLVQKNSADSNGEVIPDVVEGFEAIRVNSGQEVVIPPGSFYALVNTNKDNILVVRHNGRSRKNSSSDNPNSQILRDMRGFAYYVIEHDGKPALRINPRYNEVRNNDFGGIPVLPIPQE